jgi:hypothetical protein
MIFNKIVPEIIQHNFLNQDELLDIKNRVFDLKKLWEYINPNIKEKDLGIDSVNTQMLPPGLKKLWEYTNLVNKEKDLGIDSVNTQMLPPGMYARSEFLYMISVKKFRPIMKEHFNTYYDKIKTKIETVYNKPVVYLDKTHYPGFHIYALRENQPSSYSYYNFHKDKFSFLKKITDVGEIVSVIIPISIPRLGGSLLYTTQKYVSNRKVLPDEYVKLEYKPGTLAQWGSDIIHSIEPFNLSENECRITIQMHLNIKENEINIFW